MFLPTASAAIESVSTSQYKLSNSDGATWTAIDWSKEVLFTPTKDCTAIVSANADLWTANAGFNQDIGIAVVDGPGFPSVAGQPEGWKESGGFAGTFSPNAAYMQIVLALKMNTTYSMQLVWKTNKNAAGATIYAGAGPIGGAYSPTRLTVQPIGC
jgi:hypothetical protein